MDITTKNYQGKLHNHSNLQTFCNFSYYNENQIDRKIGRGDFE